MRRGTTPYLTIFTNWDLTAFETVIFTIRDQRGNRIDVDNTGENMQITSGAVAVRLTQEQTLSLHGESVEMQLRAADAGGNAAASDIMRARLRDILKEGVIGGET